ncbi:P-loop containing nucleoside triphosphate hydrolase protein [Coniella lustricola]|uniref:P-loop containing nucleoside triphosphate hydrolase protein n=1 Tax=Coniella lustricola TaxID=2025994 RepID=A0A2T3A497_9PEZI|nr:P-loop containing nucleoside triphosphate hydrolase protein [Coniella lustricola]
MPVNDEARPRRKTSKPKRFDYKRVDQVWDNARHQFLLEDTLEATSETRYFGYCFHVRRTFDWEGKYKTTVVDIKNKVLRDCIQEIIGDIKGVSFVEDIPRIDPNILFLYLEDMRRYAKGLKKQIANPPGADRRARKKEAKLLEEKRRLLKAMIEYIDRDYEGIKNSLYPLLEHGLITFDLLWALWKPGTFAYGTTYGSAEHPRALKVEGAEKRHNLTKGPSYLVFASHLDYDGKNFGTSGFLNEIDEFQGTKKITSLACYPLEYHPNEESLRLELIERGKKFVALSGVHYKFHRGMAYFKKKKGVGKVNVNGRIMVDAALHRRVNANYPVASIQPRDDTSPPIVDGSTDSDDFEYDDDDDHDDDVDSKSGGAVGAPSAVVELEVRNVASITKTKTGLRLVQSLKEGGGGAAQADGFAPVDAQNGSDKESGGAQTDNSTTKPSKKTPNFTDEEYLIASSVVFGFSLSMKLWLEFPVSGIEDITWNEGAYDSLVLKAETKEVVKSLVESHKFHAAESIDDVIEGKGKGLVAVLHGPPGTGKTLTAEGISELLKCPLYMVSAGELGIDSRTLEARLQQILEICHAWGAILLLDEADVFLEARNLRDIQRNALVSVFLRLLEYFQGILFLTTNRVETFDDAFQSRIHIALRYDPLDLRARKTIFKMFVDKACAQQKSGEDRIVFTDEDYGNLSRYNLNGRQIKNTVIRAQALAVNKAEPLSMKHVRQILDVQVSFDQDLKGGSGYEDAMRSYY